jgi:adenylate cyclase
VASRVEGRCKSLAVDILIGETTRAAARDMAALEVDRVRLVGKSATSRLFALVGDEECARSGRFGELSGEHDAMLAAYRARDWDGALERLRRCQHLGRGYGLAAFYGTYAARVDAWRAAPPPPDWDGSAMAESKR